MISIDSTRRIVIIKRHAVFQYIFIVGHNKTFDTSEKLIFSDFSQIDGLNRFVNLINLA